MTYKLDDEIVYGKNSLGSKEIFKQRSKYKELYPSGSEFPGSFSFWEGENLYYGRVDLDQKVLFPNENYLKQVVGTQQTVFALNFVADAFQDFQQFMKITIDKKFVPDEAITAPWTATKGWQNVHEAHHEGMRTAYVNFAGSYLDLTGKHKIIKGHESFLDVFFNDYISNTIQDVPFTKTGFIRSKYFTPLMSGLCIEIDSNDHGSDYEKYNKFVNNINYRTYLLAAAKFGFVIDQDAPWRLVANLNSNNMRAYISKYMVRYSNQGTTTTNWTNFQTKHNHSYKIDELGNGYTDYVEDPQSPGILHRHKIENYRVVKEESVTYDKLNNIGIGPHAHFLATEPLESFTTRDVYNTFFIKSDEYDIDSLKVYLRQFYNTYATAFPSVGIPVLTDCSPSSLFTNYANASKTRISTSFRETVDEEKFNEKYPDLFWTKTYFIMRLRELGADIDSPKLRKNLQKIEKMYKLVDKQAALEYINQYLKQYY